MPDDRPWYRQPETFIACAALVVSVSAVAVGIYEAALQRKHDRAEVWPRAEISTYIMPKGAAVYVRNNGIGPAIVESIDVTVDGRPQRNWDDALRAAFGRPATISSNSTVAGRAIRAGDTIELVTVPAEQIPTGFWAMIGRVRVALCYRSVFDERWSLTAKLGGAGSWQAVDRCPAQRDSADF